MQTAEQAVAARNEAVGGANGQFSESAEIASDFAWKFSKLAESVRVHGRGFSEFAETPAVQACIFSEFADRQELALRVLDTVISGHELESLAGRLRR